MNGDFLRREWGAVAFLVATALGIIVVPVGLNLAHHPTAAVTESLVPTTPSPLASGAATASPSAAPSPSPVPSPSPSPSPVPAPSPSDIGAPSPSPS